MSRCIFKWNNGSDHYAYAESKVLYSILDYQEQCTLITENDTMGEKQTYWNERHNEQFNLVKHFHL